MSRVTLVADEDADERRPARGGVQRFDASEQAARLLRSEEVGRVRRPPRLGGGGQVTQVPFVVLPVAVPRK